MNPLIITEITKSKIQECKLAELSKNNDVSSINKMELDKPIAKDVNDNKKKELSKIIEDISDGNNTDAGKNETRNCPIENGSWDSERGNSVWKPDSEYIPQKANPEQETWKEILDKYGIDSISFKDGEPDFSKISKGSVEIKQFSDNRSDNFDKADIALAKQKCCSPEEVAKWRKENGYTWHECKDMKTMQKAPSEVHNNIPHSGGISEAKKGLGESL